jgi:hypothetical protein
MHQLQSSTAVTSLCSPCAALPLNPSWRKFLQQLLHDIKTCRMPAALGALLAHVSHNTNQCRSPLDGFSSLQIAGVATGNMCRKDTLSNQDTLIQATMQAHKGTREGVETAHMYTQLTCIQRCNSSMHKNMQERGSGGMCMMICSFFQINRSNIIIWCYPNSLPGDSVTQPNAATPALQVLQHCR